ncbi:SEC-C domain-containing protein [Paenibacillus oenotherae]|uniref:SEC-C domain-containing protein n=1 Tax=Paenibacillus oenotherae TaxID=1435645 RepID=A0ABS7D921_9BACL|nr:SEC-C domain-containing protein [Paenibacillus oenotherae]MBW7475673.1 SEC-C domain-containing protein [Paenibacillus oenotherae]
MNAQMVWDQYKEVQECFPDLVLIPVDHRYFIRGTLQFRAEFMGLEVKESFLIEIELLTTYPHSLPIARELGGRIPKGFHKFVNGTLCLGTPLAMKITFSKNPTLLGFIKELIVPYLYSYAHYERNNRELPFGELSHNGEGLLEYYMDLFQVSSIDKAMQILYSLSFEKIRGHWPCPCGSNLKIRNCHGPMLMNLYNYQDATRFKSDLVHCWEFIKRK